MDADEIKGCIDRMNGINATVVSAIYRRCNALMEYKAMQSDKRSRYNRANLLGKESKRITEKFKYTEGEMVSYGGRKVSLNSLEPAGSEHPTTCWVTDKTGKSLHVRVDSLRPLSVDVAEKLMPKGDEWNAVGKFVVFDSPDGLSGGIVTATASSGTIRVHDWMPVLCKTGVIWAPVWTDLSNENPARYLKCPDKHQPHLITVKTSDIICSSDLAARKLTTAAVSFLENLGYDQFSAP